MHAALEIDHLACLFREYLRLKCESVAMHHLIVRTIHIRHGSHDDLFRQSLDNCNFIRQFLIIGNMGDGHLHTVFNA